MGVANISLTVKLLNEIIDKSDLDDADKAIILGSMLIEHVWRTLDKKYAIEFADIFRTAVERGFT